MIKAYQFYIELLDTHTPIWRRVVVPAEITFKRLHDTFQFAMDWRNEHLYEFEMKVDAPDKKVNRIQILEDEETYQERTFQQHHLVNKEEPLSDIEERIKNNLIQNQYEKAWTTKLPKFIESYPEFIYHYDFGDDWRHFVELEKVIDTYEHGYPMLIDGEGACPPEDVGGVSGYAHFLERWKDPAHPDHQDVKNWGDSIWFTDNLDLDKTNELMQEILKLKRLK